MQSSSLLIVQPYLTKYRLPVFKSLSEIYKVELFASESNQYGSNIHDNTMDIDVVTEKVLFNILYWQPKLLNKLLKSKYDTIFIAANPRYLSTWLALIVAKFKGINILLHGQGLYKKEKISFANKLTYFLYSKLCDQYIAYTQYSKESLAGLSIHEKTSVAENSIVNENTVSIKTGFEQGLLFIGRLREGSNIRMLIDAVIEINQSSSEPAIYLHIVGDGSSLGELKQSYSQYQYIKFYGEVYDSREISEISKSCFAGCYPGDAGLSILHYMSLSLPPIVHSKISMHMGPEPSYIEDGVNGKFFEREDLSSLKEAIRTLLDNKRLLASMQKNAFLTYKDIIEPSLAERIEHIIQKVIN